MQQNSIIVAVDDLFFRSKIHETAKWLQTNPVIVKNYSQLEQNFKNLRPKLIIVDLNFARFEPLESIEKLKKSFDLSSSLVIGFLSHVQLGLRNEAMEKGYDYVFPKSLFVQKLAEIIQDATQEKKTI